MGCYSSPSLSSSLYSIHLPLDFKENQRFSLVKETRIKVFLDIFSYFRASSMD